MIANRDLKNMNIRAVPLMNLIMILKQKNAKRKKKSKKRLEELTSHYEQQQSDQEDEAKKEVHSISDGLALLHNKDEQKATAIFKIPDQSKIYGLSDQEKERAKELFRVYSIENHGEYKIIKFQYKNGDILPQNKEQAIYLLYSPYVKNNSTERLSSLEKSPLNELQKKAMYLKILGKIPRKIIEKKPDLEELKKKVAIVK